MLMQYPSYSNCSTEEVTEIPLCFSISIQSDTACRAVAFPFTEPARLIAPPYNRNFSVSVVFPASGCEMIAKVLLLLISSCKLPNVSSSNIHESMDFAANSGSIPKQSSTVAAISANVSRVPRLAGITFLPAIKNGVYSRVWSVVFV